VTIAVVVTLTVASGSLVGTGLGSAVAVAVASGNLGGSHRDGVQVGEGCCFPFPAGVGVPE